MTIYSHAKAQGHRENRAGRRSQASSCRSSSLLANEPLLESNDDVQPMQDDDSTDDPIGRRIDDVLTTAQTLLSFVDARVPDGNHSVP